MINGRDEMKKSKVFSYYDKKKHLLSSEIKDAVKELRKKAPFNNKIDCYIYVLAEDKIYACKELKCKNLDKYFPKKK